MLSSTDDISLEKLLEEAMISPGAYNICMQNGLSTIGKLIQYYNTNKTFQHFRNCGARKDTEIIDIIHQFEDAIVPGGTIEKAAIPEYITKDKIHIGQEHQDKLFRNAYDILSSSPPQMDPLLQDHFENACRPLSARAQKVLDELLKGQGTATRALRKIFKDGFNINQLKCIGEKAATELAVFKISLYNTIIAQNAADEGKLPVQSDLSAPIPEIFDTFKAHMAPGPKKNSFGDALKALKLFGPAKKNLLEDHFNYHRTKLANRPQNGISRLLVIYRSVSRVLEIMFADSFTFEAIRNIGERTARELNLFRQNIYDAIIHLEELSDDRIKNANSTIALLKAFRLHCSFGYIYNELLDNTGKVRIFKLINLLILEGVLFSDTYRTVFISHFQINDHSLTDLADQLQLSKERIRQLKRALAEEIESRFDFLHSFNINDIQTYNIDVFNADGISMLDDEIVTIINKKEDTAFNLAFCARILGILFRESHVIFCNNGSTGKRCSRRYPCKISRYYLIERSNFQSIDLQGLVEDVNKKINSRIKKTYSIYFEGYLLNFYKPDCIIPIISAGIISEYILFTEFDLTISPEGFLIFEKNTKKFRYEYIYEILPDPGQLMNIDEKM